MDAKERTLLILQFSNFINNNFELVKSIYKLFKNGESDFKLDDGNITLKSVNFDEIKHPEDILATTLLLAYISMKQLDNPNIDQIICSEEELEEVIMFSNWQKENNKKLIKMLEE